ncbi:MAG: hypothetical protein EXR64_03045 [Dehalococcoidia bacterium]|nr:hypothetical protein [Dehalococcoidia bacterium]
MTRPPVRACALAALAFGALLAVALASARGVEAQTPSTPSPAPTAAPPRIPTDAEALAVEHQLLCPLCVNERLDICTLAICNDMKQIVRARLAQGASTEEIIAYFEERYGPHIRAEVPRRGFNLVLFGWVGGALAFTAAAAAVVLTSMRRATLSRARGFSGAPSEDPALDTLIETAEREEFGAPSNGRAGDGGGR